MSRNVASDEEEQEEKVTLNLACIYFLKVASDNPIARAFMINQTALAQFKESLYYEHLYMKDYPVPMDLENTFIGSNNDYLLRCISEEKAISPDSLVAYRLVSKMADNLLGIQEPLTVAVEGETAIEQLKHRTREAFSKKVLDELKPWEELNQNWSKEVLNCDNHIGINLDKSMQEDSLRDTIIKNHRLITQFEGLSRLVQFVARKQTHSYGN